MTVPLLEATGIVRDVAPRGPRILHDVALRLEEGETLGIIGGSGSGKSTLARILMALEPPDAGTLRLRGVDVFRAPRATRRALRPHIQAVFQDPYGSLDPRQRIGAIVGEPLAAAGVGAGARQARVLEALEAVALPASTANRYAHEFSGGQRQRIAIARALITRPAVVVADEPVSALDVLVQAQVINLLLELRARTGMALVFISHDLDVVRHLAHRIMVLHEGRIVEEGATDGLFTSPRHDATRRLLASRPRPPAPVRQESFKIPC